MTDHERDHELAVEKAQPHVADEVVRKVELLGQVKQNGGDFCGDPDPYLRPGSKRERLVEGGKDSIPFFSSFFDNLGPRYWASAASDVRLGMTPPGQGQPVKCKSKQTDSDGVRKPDRDGFTGTAPKLGNVTLTPGDDAVQVYTPDSSRRGELEDLNLEIYESDDLTSTFKPKLVATSSGTYSARDVLTEVPSTSSRRGKCTRRIDFEARGKDTPVSSTESTAMHHPVASHQSRKTVSTGLRDKQSKYELGDRSSSSLKSTQLRSESLELNLDYPRIAPAILPSWGDDFEEIKRNIDAVRYTRAAQRRYRLRMRMSPGISVSRSEEAVDKTRSTLRHWHFLLDLDNPACPTVASHIFYRAFRMFQRSTWPTQMPEIQVDRVRVLLAVAFWIAAKIVDTIHKIPTASRMASTASITAHSLIHTELPLLDALQWKLVRY